MLVDGKGVSGMAKTHLMVNGFPVCNSIRRDGGILGTKSPKIFSVAVDAGHACAKCSAIFARVVKR